MDVEVELTTNHWGIYISSVFLGSTVQYTLSENLCSARSGLTQSKTGLMFEMFLSFCLMRFFAENWHTNNKQNIFLDF